MIDWITAIFPVDVEVNGGICVHIDGSGEVEYETKKYYQAEGSHSAVVSIRSVWDTGETKKPVKILGSSGTTIYPNKLYISGNPTKFLQGHNIWGVNDLHGIMTDFVKLLCKSLKFSPDITDRMIQLAVTGRYDITRIDLTESFILPTVGDVRAWIRAAAQVGTGRNQSVNSYKERTLYLGKNSRRMTIKAYAKGDEIAAPKHKPPYDRILSHLYSCYSDTCEVSPLYTPRCAKYAEKQIQDYANRLLRIELTLRGMALKDMGLNKGSYWRDGMIQEVYNNKIQKLELPENATLSATDILSLPLHLQGYIALWQSGHNLKEHLGKRNYYKVRNQLKEVGIDIKSPPAGQKSNVVPLIKVITAEPAVIPQFAFDNRLVHIPVKRFASGG